MLETQLIPQVDRQLSDTKKLVQLGEVDSLILLESLTRSHDAKLKVIQNQLEQSQVRTRMQRILGHANLTLPNSSDVSLPHEGEE